MTGLKKKNLPITNPSYSNTTPSSTQHATCIPKRRSDALLLILGMSVFIFAVLHITWHSQHLHSTTHAHNSGLKNKLDGFVRETKGERIRGADELTGERSYEKSLQMSGSGNKVKDDSSTIDHHVNKSASDANTNHSQPIKAVTENNALVDSKGIDVTQHTSSQSNTERNNTKPNSAVRPVADSNNKHNNTKTNSEVHPVAHLNCVDHGGPLDQTIIDEMVFWSDIPSDASYVSPMYDANAPEKYLTFEP